MCKLCDNKTHTWAGLSRFAWLALPGWLLFRHYMNRVSPESPFLYRDWMQCAWAVCYPLSCFSLGWYSPFPLTSPIFQSPPSWAHTPEISVPPPHPARPQKTFSYTLLHIKYTFIYPSFYPYKYYQKQAKNNPKQKA